MLIFNKVTDTSIALEYWKHRSFEHQVTSTECLRITGSYNYDKSDTETDGFRYVMFLKIGTLEQSDRTSKDNLSDKPSYFSHSDRVLLDFSSEHHWNMEQ